MGKFTRVCVSCGERQGEIASLRDRLRDAGEVADRAESEVARLKEERDKAQAAVQAGMMREHRHISRVAELEALSRAFLDRVNEILEHPTFKAVFSSAHIHGVEYGGPVLTKEKDALAAALPPQPAAPEEPEPCKYKLGGCNGTGEPCGQCDTGSPDAEDCRICGHHMNCCILSHENCKPEDAGEVACPECGGAGDGVVCGCGEVTDA